jgi:hypothetical protein
MSVMTEATTGANKAKTAKHTASSFGVHNYEMPKFDLPKMEMPDSFREMAEKGAAQAKDNYEKIQAATVEATELLKDTYTTAAKGATLTAAQYRAKAAEYAELLKAASLPAEVHEFRRRERSYLMLAENEEWMADNRDKINTRGADENSYGDAILAPPDRVFDDTWATFRISGDGFDNCPFAIGTKVKMRLLHNFHIRDGMIAKEIGYEVWRRDE